jgi:broad specificity phosphatase PhoE
MQAIFIRHAQSTANAGEPTSDFARVPLTELGWQQARTLAASWTFAPSRIILSPFLRTIQTADPTIARFPQVPVETWDIHEFTFWDPVYWGGGEPRDQPEAVACYWNIADPDHHYGTQAESFADMLRRAEGALQKLQSLKVDAPVLLFTHGHFLQALRQTILHPQWSDKEKMQDFIAFDDAEKVQNTQLVPASFDGQNWRLD